MNKRNAILIQIKPCVDVLKYLALHFQSSSRLVSLYLCPEVIDKDLWPNIVEC